MKYFSMPADFKNETLDQYDRLNRQYADAGIIETYGSLSTGDFMGSGRSFNLKPQADLTKLESYVRYSAAKAIGFNYTLNSTCLGNKEFSREGLREIIRFLKNLYEIGIRSLTVALPSLIEIIKSTGYDFEIKASTLCGINNANKAVSFKKLGAARIVAEEWLNRDFKNLQEIRTAFGEKVEIIINSVCHKNCIYRPFHYNQMSHDFKADAEQASVDYYSHRCVMKRVEAVSNLLKLSWVRPEDLQYYQAAGIEYYKIQGRQAVMKGDPVRAVESYIKENYEGNLLELLDVFSPTNHFLPYLDNKKLDGFIKPFVEAPGFCRNNCTTCRYCENFIKKCLDYEKAEETFSLAGQFYQGFDQFIKNMDETNRECCEERLQEYQKRLFAEKDLEIDLSLLE